MCVGINYLLSLIFVLASNNESIYFWPTGFKTDKDKFILESNKKFMLKLNYKLFFLISFWHIHFKMFFETGSISSQVSLIIFLVSLSTYQWRCMKGVFPSLKTGGSFDLNFLIRGQF